MLGFLNLLSIIVIGVVTAVIVVLLCMTMIVSISIKFGILAAIGATIVLFSAVFTIMIYTTS